MQLTMVYIGIFLLAGCIAWMGIQGLQKVQNRNDLLYRVVCCLGGLSVAGVLIWAVSGVH